MRNINLRISESPAIREKCDALVIFVPDKSGTSESFTTIDRRLNQKLSSLLKQEHFQAKPGDTIVYHAGARIAAARVILTGLGKREKFSEDIIRRAAAAAALAARNAACGNLSYTLPLETGIARERLAQ